VIEVDFHSHTIFSKCGVHTVMEMLEAAKARGIKGLTITDHGPALGGRVNSVFFERVQNPVDGIRLLKGMECNLIGSEGKIDCPLEFLKYMDLVLLGIHPNIRSGLGANEYTSMLLEALDRNPYVDVLSHLNNSSYPVSYPSITKAAAKYGMAVEINNSKIALDRTPIEDTESLVLACKRAECRVALCSDAHVVQEVGSDEGIRPVLDRMDFPASLIVNRNEDAAMAFIEERRKVKQDFLSGQIK